MYDYDRRVAARPKAPVDERAQELMSLLERHGRARAWMSKIHAETEQRLKIPGNEGWSFEDMYPTVVGEWLPRANEIVRGYACEVLNAYEKNPAVERLWYAKVKRDRALLHASHGPLRITEEDLAIFEITDRPGSMMHDEWMTTVLDWAGISALENGQGDEWDPRDEGMAEGYYLDHLRDIFGRDLGSYAGDRMSQFMKNRSFEAAWYTAVEAVIRAGGLPKSVVDDPYEG